MTSGAAVATKPALREVEVLARMLMHNHGLVGWTFTFSRARTQLGLCNFSTRTISLSKHWAEVRSLQDSRATILHEIAHALAGGQAKHGPKWRAQARAIGLANPQPCTATGDAKLSETPPWAGTCSAGHEVTMWRAPRRVSACLECSRRPALAHAFTWKKHGKTHAMPESYIKHMAKLVKQAGGLT